MRRFTRGCVLALASALLAGCSTPPVPPEVRLAEIQADRLWRAGAPELAPEDYRRYQRSHRSVRDRFLRERNRFAFLRDYDLLTLEYRSLLYRGGRILGDLNRDRKRKAADVDVQLTQMADRVALLDRLTCAINEGRLARRNLTKAALLIDDARHRRAKEQFEMAKTALFEAGICLRSAEAILKPIIARYDDRTQLGRWQTWVAETVRESRERGVTAIVVTKADRNLTVYRGGQPVRTYRVGLGRNGLCDKLYSGDHATPEGRYQVIKKVSRSKYYKALLINYPNEEDKRQFLQAKKRGQLPGRVGIGGLVEIHGGGAEGMTYGCISLDDRFMDEVYNLAEVGTLVTIVGTTDHDNFLSSANHDL